MADWIPVDAGKLDIDEKSEIAGVNVSIGLSPFDIPSDVRGYYDSNVSRFVIEFKYLNENESVVTQTPHEHIKLIVGKESGCLYRILLDVDQLKATSVAVQVHKEFGEVEKTLRELASKMQRGVRRRHYDVVAEVVEDNADQLIGAGE